MSPARPHPLVVGLVGLVIAALVAGCGVGGGSNPPSNPATGCAAPDPAASTGCATQPPEASITPTTLVVGLGYIPSVQFAQFYLAQLNGYYAQAGLTVEFQNKIDPDLITLVGQGAIDIGIGDGTSVIPAVSNGIPVEYIATIYGRFPNVVFAKASSGITTAADLKGKKIGTPGRYGSGWIMLQALLASANLTTDDVEIVEYPDFTQRAAVEQGVVDAATGFANNEPVQLELGGTKAVVLTIDQITPLPGPGLIASTKTLDAKHDAAAAFVAATLQAMEEIKANPTVGLDAAIKAVPELATQRDAQAAVLAATVATWTGVVQGTRGLGAIDRDGWTKSIAYLGTLGLVKNPVTVDQLVREDLLPGAD
ncbi:MAG: ABC transporter substrate-binding protein [Chloroflexota bacterium]